MESSSRNKKLPNKNELISAETDLWVCHLKATETTVPYINANKEYLNSHRQFLTGTYGPAHLHVYFGNETKLRWDLDHKVPVDLTANVRSNQANIKTIDYDANNETLLHIAARQSNKQHNRDCLELLLERGADANREHEYIENSKQKTIKTPLIYTLESKNEAAVQLLFAHAQTPVQLDKILNKETPLMTAIRCDNAVALLLKMKADANLGYVSKSGQETNTPLAMAVRKRDLKLVELLLKEGNANPNTPISNLKQSIISEFPLHIALKNQDAQTVKLLLHYGAAPSAIAKYEDTVNKKPILQHPHNIKTSDECRKLLLSVIKTNKKAAPWYTGLFGVLGCTVDASLPDKEHEDSETNKPIGPNQGSS